MRGKAATRTEPLARRLGVEAQMSSRPLVAGPVGCLDRRGTPGFSPRRAIGREKWEDEGDVADRLSAMTTPLASCCNSGGALPVDDALETMDPSDMYEELEPIDRPEVTDTKDPAVCNP